MKLRMLPILLAAALAACGPAPEPVMGGYAEADLVYIAPTSAGLLLTVGVKRGDQVKRGQPLFVLDSDAEALSSGAAQARRERAEAQAADLRKGKRPDELRALEQQQIGRASCRERV